jgi:hypothetical protein
MALERLSQVGAQAALPLGQVNCPIATRGIPSKFVVDRDSTVSDRDKEVPCDVTYRCSLLRVSPVEVVARIQRALFVLEIVILRDAPGEISPTAHDPTSVSKANLRDRSSRQVSDDHPRLAAASEYPKNTPAAPKTSAPTTTPIARLIDVASGSRATPSVNRPCCRTRREFAKPPLWKMACRLSER